MNRWRNRSCRVQELGKLEGTLCQSHELDDFTTVKLFVGINLRLSTRIECASERFHRLSCFIMQAMEINLSGSCGHCGQYAWQLLLCFQ